MTELNSEPLHRPGSSPRDFPEDFGKYNGDYVNTCYSCPRAFFGHKRRVACKVCEGRADD